MWESMCIPWGSESQPLSLGLTVRVDPSSPSCPAGLLPRALGLAHFSHAAVRIFPCRVTWVLVRLQGLTVHLAAVLRLGEGGRKLQRAV